MTDPVSVASATIALLSQAIQSQEEPLTSHNAVEDRKRVQLDLKSSLQTFQVWQETWSGQAEQPDVSSEALWGLQGWANIRRMLDNVVAASKEIENCLIELQESRKPRSRWRLAVKSLRSKKQPKSELQRLAARLNNAIDELWIYSETVFDSLHGVMAQESRLPSREILLTSALQSRPGSLQLYGYCAESPLNCSLAMDLLDAGSDSLHTSSPLQSPLYGHRNPMHLFYQIFTKAPNLPMQLEKMVVESIPESDLSIRETGDIVQSSSSEVQLFKPRTETTIIQVGRQGSGSASCLRIPKIPLARILLKSAPERLTSVLETLQSTGNLSTKEHFSIGAKIELAFKLVESAFFLLGTPWFSSLSSKNLLRLKRAGQHRHSFVLEIQTLDFSDLLFDDPTALAENSQLFKIGVLLMEIALDKTDFSSRIEDRGKEIDTIRLLPEIERSMGAQYCMATAFCLQHRQPHAQFGGPEKYSSPHFEKWETYLTDFLLEFYSQVFSRRVISASHVTIANVS